MKDETKTWLDYSKENLESSKILIKRKLFNPCLQNIQQSIEKALKAILIEQTIKYHRISRWRVMRYFCKPLTIF
ncbi:MAG: HEPN domain-containing protein [Candidatus Marinimicrobia bacterium]|nr:HEPN domain-containing protein [Candidatus Neomarinimicrobiota bacterium]